MTLLTNYQTAPLESKRFCPAHVERKMSRVCPIGCMCRCRARVIRWTTSGSTESTAKKARRYTERNVDLRAPELTA